MRLSVAVPCARDWKASFGCSLLGLTRKLSESVSSGKLEAFDMFIMQGASNLPRARQLSIDNAKQGGFTHVLCLDDDMVFSTDLVDDLSSHNVDIVGINYVRKNPQNPSPQTHGLDGKPVSSLGKFGLEEVGWIGFGGVLIHLDAIKDIPAPLFEMRWMEDRKDFIGEDFYFCGKVRAHGLKIHVDHTASNKCAHVGDFAYREVKQDTSVFEYKEG
jgi:hypothetical protein